MEAEDTGKLKRVEVVEMYSVPRVTVEAKKFGLEAGEAMDLTTGWDFRLNEHRECAKRYIHEYKPKLLIGSPMCTAFSTWQRLNDLRRDPEEVARAWSKAMKHLSFVCELYLEQLHEGRYFLHEHPACASSWTQTCVMRLMAHETVDRVRCDQCQYGQQASQSWTSRRRSHIEADMLHEQLSLLAQGAEQTVWWTRWSMYKTTWWCACGM